MVKSISSFNRYVFFIIAIFIFFTFSATANPLPDWLNLSPQTKKDLINEGITAHMYNQIINGKILTQKRIVPQGKTGVHVAAFGLIKSSAETIFDAVDNCAKLHEFMPYFKSCRNVTPSYQLPPNEQWNENSLHFSFPLMSINIKMIQHSVRMRPYRLSWKKVHGDTKLNEGYYHIIPLNKHSQFLVYDVITDAGRFVPNFIQNILTEKNMPTVIEAIKKRVEYKI